MTDDPVPAPPEARPRPRARTPYSVRLAKAICARVAGGESVVAICESAGMPNHRTVSAWRKKHPRFGVLLDAARKAAGVKARSGQLSTFCPTTADAILERMCEGETVMGICRDPEMPGFSTVYRWRRTFPDFAEAMQEAREIQAELFCDLGWEVAAAVTPQTAFATSVKLTQIRWMAGMLQPHRYLARVVAEGAIARARAEEDPERQGLTVIVKRFSDVTPEEEEAARLTEAGYFDGPRRGRER
ncbi:MAG: hypothetical protein ACJ798_14695 [Phenylobacterium sp.]